MRIVYRHLLLFFPAAARLKGFSRPGQLRFTHQYRLVREAFSSSASVLTQRRGVVKVPAQRLKSNGVSSIHRKHHPRNIFRCVGCQKTNCIRNVLGRAEFSKRRS